MLLSIRAGRSTRPCTSFVRLARYRAHRRQESSISAIGWRTYATEVGIQDENTSTGSGSLLGTSNTSMASKDNVDIF